MYELIVVAHFLNGDTILAHFISCCPIIIIIIIERELKQKHL